LCKHYFLLFYQKALIIQLQSKIISIIIIDNVSIKSSNLCYIVVITKNICNELLKYKSDPNYDEFYDE